LPQAANPEISRWVERIRSGEPRALARAISLVEDRRPEAQTLLRALFPYSGKARIIGMTGSPGAGKSTLVDQLAKHYRGQGDTSHAVAPTPGAARVGQPTLGIIAVDPTSPFSGGAILGDRIRMLSHHGDSGIYIRSMATRGALGGLAATTADVATVLDASGRDLLLIETVGVGQDEIDIVRLADITVVILVPGMGDDVQSIKAGIMEIADIFVINKSDREGAERVEREIRAMQSIAVRSNDQRTDEWSPPIVKTVATEGKGTAELAEAIAAYEQFLEKRGLLPRKRAEHWRIRLVEMLRDALLHRVLREQMSERELERYAAEIAEHKRDPYALIDEVVRGLAAGATKS